MNLRALPVPTLALLIASLVFGSVVVQAQQSIAAQPATQSISILDSTRDQDGLSGPVRRVHTEMSKVTVNGGAAVEDQRMLLEVTTYDPQGKRIWNVYYPVATGSFKGNQEFAYNEQGHVKEMTLRDDSGRVLSREGYNYEFDSFGNWTKMTSSLVIFEGGKLVTEPFEVTYRTISYYFDDSVAQIVKSSATSQALLLNPTTTAAVDKSNPIKTEPATNQQPTTDQKALATNNAEKAVSVPSNNTNAESSAQHAKTEPPRDQGSQNKSEADVAAKSTPTQAYQMPAQPIESGTSTKQNVSGGVIDGKVLSLPKPVYPSVALARGVFGKVVVEIMLDEQGRVIDARAISGNPLLRVTAVAAARQARFEPTLLSGQPVKATRLIDYDFRK